MFQFEPRDVFIECKGCGFENTLTQYTPEIPALCKDCRTALIGATLDDSHNEFICEDCGFTMLLLKDTPFEESDAKCRCGSENVLKMDASTVAEEAHEFLEYGDDEEEDDEEDEDTRWIRSNLDDLEDAGDGFEKD
jgi:hypothetical protein